MPSGNNLEGNSSPNLWKWNQTIGSPLNRPGRPGTWGYYNTDGLGLIEYIHWAQDLGAEPILAVWSLLGRRNHTSSKSTTLYPGHS